MTDKEAEIKALAGTIFDLRQALDIAKNEMIADNTSFDYRRKSYAEYVWINYQITVAEKKLEAATL